MHGRRPFNSADSNRSIVRKQLTCRVVGGGAPPSRCRRKEDRDVSPPAPAEAAVAAKALPTLMTLWPISCPREPTNLMSACCKGGGGPRVRTSTWSVPDSEEESEAEELEEWELEWECEVEWNPSLLPPPLPPPLLPPIPNEPREHAPTAGGRPGAVGGVVQVGVPLEGVEVGQRPPAAAAEPPQPAQLGPVLRCCRCPVRRVRVRCGKPLLPAVVVRVGGARADGRGGAVAVVLALLLVVRGRIVVQARAERGVHGLMPPEGEEGVLCVFVRVRRKEARADVR